MATGLYNLADLYRTQGRYSDAEPLYKQALAIWEFVLGPEHHHVASGLESYAALLREIGETAQAHELEARAKAIRSKTAG